MTDKQLSPAAQAVLTAVTQRQYCLDPCDVPEATGRIKYEAAAVLRAAADQVVPETTTPWNSTLFLILSTPEVRAKLLAIADELENYG
jgi:molybdopterin-guanine dinucleotide biosynthesis protein A